MVQFLRLRLAHELAELRPEPGSTLDQRLQRFHDDFLQDSSGVRLHAKLATKWPATRSRTPAAGVKVATLVSLRANGPRRVELHGETVAEITTLRVGPWVKGALLITDPGIYQHQVFARIEENAGRTSPA